MNANERTVQYLLSDDWHVVVTEHIAMYPNSISLVVEPSVMGQYDCEQGRPCDPTAHGYRRLADVEAYCIAYRDTAALWAEMVERKNADVDAERAWLDGELQELVDGIEDNEYWRTGQW